EVKKLESHKESDQSPSSKTARLEANAPVETPTIVATATAPPSSPISTPTTPETATSTPTALPTFASHHESSSGAEAFSTLQTLAPLLAKEFQSYDKNSNGNIEASEVNLSPAELKRLDFDGDGSVDLEDIKDIDKLLQRGQEWAKEVDKTKNGFPISQDNFD